MLPDIIWLVGRRSNLSLWSDNWVNGKTLASMFQMPTTMRYTKQHIVMTFIADGKWTLPPEFAELLRDLWNEIHEVPFSDQNEDEIVWKGNTNREMAIKGCYEFYRQKAP